MKPLLQRNVFLPLVAVLGILFLMASPAAAAGSCDWLGPTVVAASPDGARLYVGLADVHQVTVIDVAGGKRLSTIAVPGEPTAIVVDPRSGQLLVPCAAPKSVVCLIDPASMRITKTIPVGHTATGAALSPDGRKLAVCNRFHNDVSILSLPDGKELARVSVAREPVGVTATRDGRTFFVINHLPAEPANADTPAACVSAIDAASFEKTDLRLHPGSSSVRGVCCTSDGRYVLVTHVLSRNQLPTTQLERGWMNTNAVSVIEAASKRLLGVVLLDDIDLGAANPWGVACTADGRRLCVAHSGTHELSVIDLPAMLEKLRGATAVPTAAEPGELPAAWKPIQAKYGQSAKFEPSVKPTVLEPANDLSFLVGLRERVALPGKGPRGIVAAGGKVFTAMYFSDRIVQVDVEKTSGASRPIAIPLGPAPKMTVVRQGDLFFHDATLCFQHWQSCASCHPDARSDALNWDLLNDGFGNPKNSKSMVYAHRAPPAMSEGIRETAETAVRAGFRGILFASRPESEAQAVDEYLKSLEPVPSPKLVNGRLSESAKRGKDLFESKRVGCAECHPAPYFTDMKAHNVGTRARHDHTDTFFTPRLAETWRTAPYLHDGSSTTVKDLLTKGKHGHSHGGAQGLAEQEVNDLVEYVLSL